MATATLNAVTTITLELNVDEATTLYDVMGRISGSPDKSRRGVTTKIRAAIAKHITEMNYRPISDIEGGISFLKPSEVEC